MNNKSKKLNLGCGEDYKPGWINADIRDNIKKDIKIDLNSIPYNFKNNYFEEIYCKDVIEHLNEPIKFLKELSRITKKEGLITIQTSHGFSYAFITDIQHKTPFTENSFCYDLMKEYELEKGIQLISTKFIWNNKWKKYIPFKKYLKIFLNGIYEEIEFKFKVKKDN